MGAQPETAACVRDAEKKKTRCASCSPQVQEPRAGAQPETAACVRDAEKKKTRCASCSPQVQEPRAGAQPETAACVRDAGKKKTRCASCSPQVCPPQARGCAGLFPLIFRLFLFGFLPLKLLFICRSGRDGNFLACPLPWLCFRPAGLVTCCFFADFCAHCLFACRALCFGCLFICLCCLRGFSLLFFTLSCLTSSSQTSFHLSLRPRRASTFFRKESRQRFARGAAPSNPHSCALRPISPFPALLAGLTALRAANRRLTGKRLKSQGAELSFSSVSVRGGRAGAFSPPGKTGAARRRAAGNSRVRARRGEEKDTVRVLLTAGAGAVRGRAAGKNRGRARLGAGKNTVRVLLTAGVPAAGAGVCRAFSSYLSPFPVWLFASQNSFHLSLRPRRGFPRLFPPAALFPARGSCHLLLFRGLLRPLPVCLFCVVRAGFLPCFSPFPA